MILSVNAKGDGFVIDFLDSFDERTARGARRAVQRITTSVFRHASAFLAGHHKAASGGYPVPSRTGHLRRQLNFVANGKSKDGFKAGDMEGIIYNSAIYAPVIALGTGSSQKFGERQFLKSGLERFMSEENVEAVFIEEIFREFY